jgi:IclR family mhp operon transcriptional activator
MDVHVYCAVHQPVDPCWVDRSNQASGLRPVFVILRHRLKVPVWFGADLATLAKNRQIRSECVSADGMEGALIGRGEGEVRAGSRVLAVLQAMNREPHSTIQSLHRVTGLPKPTLVRLLKTLVTDGYVSNDRRQAGYQITSLVTSLSSGFHGDPLVVEAGRAWAMELNAQFKWPVAIAVLEDNAVIVRFSTVHDSPVSPFHATINMRLSLFTRALGRAYLAACSDAQIQTFLETSATTNSELETPADRDPGKVGRMVQTIRDRGYATRDPNVEPRTSDTIAVPIMGRGGVQASIGLTYFRTATNAFGSRDDFVTALKRAASGINAEVERLTAHHD